MSTSKLNYLNDSVISFRKTIINEKNLKKIKSRCEKMHGTCEYNGKKYWVVSSPEMMNYGNRGDIRVYAQGIDENGGKYVIEWELLDFSIMFTGKDKKGACDWNHPIGVSEW